MSLAVIAEEEAKFTEEKIVRSQILKHLAQHQVLLWFWENRKKYCDPAVQFSHKLKTGKSEK